MRLGLSLAALALACAAVPIHAWAAQDLLATWYLALSNDPTYSAARANYGANQEKLPQARAELLPAINAEVGGLFHDTRRARNLNSMNHGTRNTWDLVLTQPLFDCSRWKSFEQAKLRVADAEVQLQQASQDLLLRVAQAYFNVLTAQDTLAATQAEKASIAEQLASAKQNFELGTATITDTYEAQARYDLVQANELLHQNTLDVQRDHLAKIIGVVPQALAELPSGALLPAPQPARLQDWSTQAETANLDVIRAQLQTEIAQRDIEIARSGHYPTLNLRAASGSNSDAPLAAGNSGRPIDSSIGLVLSIPIYSGGGTSSKVSEKYQLEQKARHDFESARRSAVQSAREYYSGVITGLARIRALEAGEKSSLAAVEANRTGYAIGVRINLDVLNAQQQLYATRRDLAQARYGALLAGLRLKASSGSLSQADIEAVNRLLEEPRP